VSDSTTGAPSKRCRACAKRKPLTDFYRDSQNRDGRRGVCVACWSERATRKRRADPVATRESDRQRRERDGERIRNRSREWARANMAQQVEYQRQRTEALKVAVFAHYGTACACCESAHRLTIDHIGGGGREHREALFGSSKAAGRTFYLWLIRNGFPGGYQTLCMRCNISKGRGERCRIAHRRRASLGEVT